MALDGSVVAALIAAAGAFIGWLIRERRRKKRVIQEICGACSTRAIYTVMHGQIALAPMFQSLAATRVKLSVLRPFVEPPCVNRVVSDIITEIWKIEKFSTEPQQPLTSEQNDAINKHKEAIIKKLKYIGEEWHIACCVHAGLMGGLDFRTLGEADSPAD